MNEQQGFSTAGIPTVFFVLLLGALGLALEGYGLVHEAPVVVAIGLGLAIHLLAGFMAKGFFQVAPNEGQVLQLFGKYHGTVREEGLRWTNPFCSRRRVSLRVRNFESSKLKVNDSDGNPIEIAAVVVWAVIDTAEAVFCVDDYENFVSIQSESALRQMAQNYPYDSHDDGTPALRSHGEVINNHLRDEIQNRLEKAGVRVIEARISHLAYAQEIAQPCCNASRPAPSWRRASASSKAPSAWWRWRWTSSSSKASSNWTKSARRPWSATCWSSCAAIVPRNRW